MATTLAHDMDADSWNKLYRSPGQLFHCDFVGRFQVLQRPTMLPPMCNQKSKIQETDSR